MIIIPKPDDLAKLAAPKGYLYRVSGDDKLLALAKSQELISNYFMSTSPDSFILYHAYYFTTRIITKRLLLVTGIPFAVDLVKEPSWWSDRDSAEQE